MPKASNAKPEGIWATATSSREQRASEPAIVGVQSPPLALTRTKWEIVHAYEFVAPPWEIGIEIG